MAVVCGSLSPQVVICLVGIMRGVEIRRRRCHLFVIQDGAGRAEEADRPRSLGVWSGGRRGICWPGAQPGLGARARGVAWGAGTLMSQSGAVVLIMQNGAGFV